MAVIIHGYIYIYKYINYMLVYLEGCLHHFLRLNFPWFSPFIFQKWGVREVGGQLHHFFDLFWPILTWSPAVSWAKVFVVASWSSWNCASEWSCWWTRRSSSSWGVGLGFKKWWFFHMGHAWPGKSLRNMGRILDWICRIFQCHVWLEGKWL